MFIRNEKKMTIFIFLYTKVVTFNKNHHLHISLPNLIKSHKMDSKKIQLLQKIREITSDPCFSVSDISNLRCNYLSEKDDPETSEIMKSQVQTFEQIIKAAQEIYESKDINENFLTYEFIDSMDDGLNYFKLHNPFDIKYLTHDKNVICFRDDGEGIFNLIDLASIFCIASISLDNIEYLIFNCQINENDEDEKHVKVILDKLPNLKKIQTWDYAQLFSKVCVEIGRKVFIQEMEELDESFDGVEDYDHLRSSETINNSFAATLKALVNYSDYYANKETILMRYMKTGKTF